MEHANKWIAAQKKINIIYPSGKTTGTQNTAIGNTNTNTNTNTNLDTIVTGLSLNNKKRVDIAIYPFKI